MIEIKFKNLERSEMAKEAVIDRLELLLEKFEVLRLSKIVVTLEMENSPVQAGPDLFKVKLHIKDGKYRGLIVTKDDINLYKALAHVADHMLEKLNRAGDKARVKKRSQARKEWKRRFEKSDDQESLDYQAS